MPSALMSSLLWAILRTCSSVIWRPDAEDKTLAISATDRAVIFKDFCCGSFCSGIMLAPVAKKHSVKKDQILLRNSLDVFARRWLNVSDVSALAATT